MADIKMNIHNYVKIKDIKKYVQDTNVSCYFKKTTVKEFENVLKKYYNINYETFAHLLINDWALLKSTSPKKITYSKNYLNDGYEDSFWSASEKRRFYDLTKFYYFIKDPITKFRNPIGLFYVDNEFVPGGRFRVAYMKHLPNTFEFYVSYSKREMFSNLFSSAELNINSDSLCNMFDLNNNNTSTLLIAHTLDQVSVTEPHKFIDFFDQDFCIEFTGKDIYVNETKIIEHKDGIYKVLGSKQHV